MTTQLRRLHRACETLAIPLQAANVAWIHADFLEHDTLLPFDDDEARHYIEEYNHFAADFNSEVAATVLHHIRHNTTPPEPPTNHHEVLAMQLVSLVESSRDQGLNDLKLSSQLEIQQFLTHTWDHAIQAMRLDIVTHAARIISERP